MTIQNLQERKRAVLQSGFDIYFSRPNSTDQLECRVCGSKCIVTRGLEGPTSMAEAVSGRGHSHDQHKCPNAECPWHDQAIELVKMITGCPSPRLIALLEADLKDLLEENIK